MRTDQLSTQLWVAPVVGTAVAVAVASAVLLGDRYVAWEDWPLPLFHGTADSARTFFSVTVTAVTTLLALVFTIIAVIIQLASGQYSPRILRTLVKDKPTHLTIGIFVGTIAYGLLCLQGIDATRDVQEDEFKSMAVSLGFVITVVAIGTFAAYSNHIVHAVRVENILALASRVALDLVDQEYPERLQPERASTEQGAAWAALGEPDQIQCAEGPVMLVDYDVEALVDAARSADVVIVLVPVLGSFVRTGGPLLEVHAVDGHASIEGRELVEHLALAKERTTTRDLPYALRQLVDVAARALSPGDNDPTTAVQALDWVHEVLYRLATRDFGDGVHRDADGQVRLLTHITTWENYIELAVDEIRRLGAGSTQVARRLLELIEDLLTVAPPHRRPVLETQHALLSHLARDATNTEADAERASQPDRRGLGL